VQEKYCADREYSMLMQTMEVANELEALTLVWSAKEAIQKCLSTDVIPFFLELSLQQCKKIDKNNVALTFSLFTNRNKRWPGEITVAAGIFKEYAIAVTTLTGDC
jgi:phosphopantetheinyl transferase (holo-ACP synthase)